MKRNLVKLNGEVLKTFRNKSEWNKFLATLLKPLKIVAKVQGENEIDYFLAC